MAIVLVDEGTTSQLSGTTLTSANWTPTDNHLIIALVWAFLGQPTISDTFVDSGGGTWQTIYNFQQAGVNAWIAAFYRQLGTGAGNHHITAGTPGNDESVLGAIDIGGHDTNTPVRQSITGLSAASSTSLTLTLGSAPKSDSCMISNCFDILSSNTLTQPTSFTALTSLAGFGGDSQASGFLNGSGATAVTWANLDNRTQDIGGYFEVETPSAFYVPTLYIPPKPFPLLRQVLNTLRDPRLEPYNRPIIYVKSVEPPQLVRPVQTTPNFRDPRLDFAQPVVRVITSAIPPRPVPKLPGIYTSLQIASAPVVTTQLPIWQWPIQTDGITTTPVNILDFR